MPRISALSFRAAAPVGWLARRFDPRLPPRVAWFYLRAVREAERCADRRTLEQASSPTSIAQLLGIARGRRRVAEIGTSAGWTTAALTLADSERQVLTYDPFPNPARERYLSLLPDEARRRIELREERGEDGPPPDRSFDLLFIDDAHVRDEVVATFRAWLPALEPGALVAFHDYHPSWPGVIGAVGQLGLKGEVRAATFVWEKT